MHERRMYERTDVPKDNPHRNAIAIGVLVVVAIAMVVLVNTCWRLANEVSVLGDEDLEQAVSNTTSVSADQLAFLANGTEWAASDASVTTLLVVVTPDDDETTLSGLYLASLNDTLGTATLMQFPLDAYLRLNDDINQLPGDYFTSGGAENLVSTIASGCAVPVSHVLQTTESGWNAFLTIAAQGADALSSQSAELIAGITRSDMEADELIELAQRAVSAGLSAESIVAVPTVEYTFDDGTPYNQIARTNVAYLVGTLA